MSTDKGVKHDDGKPAWRLFPWRGASWVQKVMDYGARKYTDNGWQSVPNAEQRYFDALLRHVVAHASGELSDPESGLPHIAHAATNALFLLHFIKAQEAGATPEPHQQCDAYLEQCDGYYFCCRSKGHLSDHVYNR